MRARGPRRTSPIKGVLGDRLRVLREGRALSQAELGRRAGTSATEVATIERGERAPTIVSLEHLARALGVPISAFFEDTELHRNSPPGRNERTWYAIMDLLRDRDVDYLRAVHKLVKAFDEAVALGGRGKRTDQTRG